MMTYNDNSHHAKLGNQGEPGICVGFADEHSVSNYHVLKRKMKKFLIKDITFLSESHGEWNEVETPTLISVS